MRSSALAAGLLLALAGCDAFAIDHCMDNGGVWLEERKACFCSYNQIGAYLEKPSPEQMEHREFCDGLTTGQSVRDALARAE